MRGRFDVAVVGAGHNGLVAAAYLARAGKSCVVLERSERCGGASVSDRLFEGVDARLSRYSYLVSLFPDSIARDLGLDLQLLRRRISSWTPDPRRGGEVSLLVDNDDAQATARSFREVTGGERELEAWRAFHAMTAPVARRLFPTLTEPLRSREQVREMVGAEAWERLFVRPLGETLDELFADEVVRGVVATDALIGTFAPLDDPALRQNRCFLYHVIGRGTGEWLLPRHGMGALARQLEMAARSAGAQLHTGSQVIGIDPAEDAVRLNVETAHGPREIIADDVVFAAAPAELQRALGRPVAQPEGSQLKVNVLLERLPRLRDGTEGAVAFAGTSHFNESAPQLQAAHAAAARGEIPSPVPCETYCHSLSDRTILGPDLRRSEAQTLTIFALHMPARLFATENDAARSKALDAVFASLDSLLAEPVRSLVVESPGGAPCIEAVTPVDLEAQLSMPGGHIFHCDLEWPFARSDDEVGRWGTETDHPRIMLGGAGALRGGGVSGIGGQNAAMALLEMPHRAAER